MVESETFVSRRKTPVGTRRGPRKLFTARGLVDHETHNLETRHGDDSSQKDGQHVDIPTSKEEKATEAPPLVNTKPPATRRVLRDSSYQEDQAISFGDTSPVPKSKNSDDESSRDSSSGDGLEGVLQMGCMDGLFFSTDKVESITKKGRTTSMKLPVVPRMNFSDRLSPNVKAMMGTSSRDFNRSFPKQFGCRQPYGDIVDQVSDNHLNSTFELPREHKRDSHGVHGAGPSPQINEKRTQPLFFQLPLKLPSASIEAPPSQIYIGEQPCFSDDLIPVDDLPPPCNLTKYHPKPLKLRPSFAFGKPMLSIDSDESDPDTEKCKNLLGLTPEDQRQEDAEVTNAMDTNDLGPSFDAGGPSFDNQEERNRSPSFDNAGPSFDKHENNETFRASTPPAPSEARRGSISTVDSGLGTVSSSSAASVASDEAISSEKPKKMSPTGPAVAHRVNKATTPSGRDTALEDLECPSCTSTTPIGQSESPAQASTSLSRQTEDYDSSTTLQDENNSPPLHLPVKGMIENNRGQQPSPIHMALGVVDRPSYRSRAPHSPFRATEIRRRPFDLRVGTNFPVSPSHNEEFFSPRTTTPKKRNSSRVGESHRFGFENESFDEAEFFDTAMA